MKDIVLLHSEIGGNLKAISRKRSAIKASDIKLKGHLGVLERDTLESNTKRLGRQIEALKEQSQELCTELLEALKEQSQELCTELSTKIKGS